jgi:hypothetical protein
MTWSVTSDGCFTHVQAPYSYPTSPVLSGNSLPQPELLRQKTWCIGSIHDLKEAPGAMSGPRLTSSPLQSEHSSQSMDQPSLQSMDPGVSDRLEEACVKIQEALSILNLGKRNKVSIVLLCSKRRATFWLSSPKGRIYACENFYNFHTK